MTNVDKEAVRAASRLEDVIPAITGDALTRRGCEFVTRCPFTRMPALRCASTSRSNGGAAIRADIGGDVFEFVEQVQRVEPFEAALAWLDAPGRPLEWQRPRRTGADAARAVAGAQRTSTSMNEASRLFKVVIAGRRPDGKKTVWQERPDGRGGWVRGTEGAAPRDLSATRSPGETGGSGGRG